MHDAANIDIIDFSGVRVELDRWMLRACVHFVCASVYVCVCVYVCA